MNQTHQPNGQELNRQVLALGTQALDLLRGFGVNQISPDELVEQLPQLGAGAILAENWGRLSGRTEHATCFEVLQFLSTLETEVGYQLLRYGPTSIHEDFRELELAVTRLKKVLHSP